MAELSTLVGTLEICLAGNVEAKLIKLTKWDVNSEVKELDMTSTDSAGSEEYMPGNLNHTIDFAGRYDTAENKLVGGPPVIWPQTLVDFSAYIDKVGHAAEVYAGTGFVRSFKVGIDYAGGEVVTYEGTLRVSGALTPPAAH